jgi:hypothetical protein
MVPRSEPATMKWARRRDIPIAILAWITLVFAILWGAGHIARTPGLTHAGVLQALVVALWKNKYAHKSRHTPLIRAIRVTFCISCR